MKQFIVFSLVLALCTSLKAQDTLVMKNGLKVGGKFIDGNGGVIRMKTDAGIMSYKTDEVSSMKFCTPTRGGGKAESGTGISCSTAAGSYSGTPCDDNLEGKGSISFECNMCSGEGKLEIKNENGKESDGGLLLVTLDEQHHHWFNRHILKPGKYKWTYSDSGKNASSGSFILKAGEERKIILFEKEN